MKKKINEKKRQLSRFFYNIYLRTFYETRLLQQSSLTFLKKINEFLKEYQGLLLILPILIAAASLLVSIFFFYQDKKEEQESIAQTFKVVSCRNWTQANIFSEPLKKGDVFINSFDTNFYRENVKEILSNIRKNLSKENIPKGYEAFITLMYIMDSANLELQINNYRSTPVLRDSAEDTKSILREVFGLSGEVCNEILKHYSNNNNKD